MKIRSERRALIVYVLILALLTWLVFDTILYVHAVYPDRSLWFDIIVGALCISLIIRRIVASFRTLEMTEKGCTISFLMFRKFYAWDRFAIKRLESYDDCRITDPVYHEGIFFSVHMRKKPKWISAIRYMNRHPWSCFAVHFKSNGKRTGFRGHIDTYEIDRQLFIEKMQIWGIVIEGLTEEI